MYELHGFIIEYYNSLAIEIKMLFLTTEYVFRYFGTWRYFYKN